MASYQTIILLNLSKWENPNKPGTGFSLDVVHQVYEGKSKGVGVEKVAFKDDGAKRYGRPLTRMDFKKLADNWNAVLNLMDNPPPVPAAPEPEPLSGGTLGGGEGLGGGKLDREEF